MARRTTAAAGKAASEVHIVVRLTPEGFAEARKRLDELEARAQEQTRRQLQELTQAVRARAGYTSEEEVAADVEEAVLEVRAEMRHEREGRR